MKPLSIRSPVFVCCFISLTVFSLQQLSGDEFDWPGIRGTEWNGISEESGIMDAWPEQGPPVLWTRQLGQGYWRSENSGVGSTEGISTGLPGYKFRECTHWETNVMERLTAVAVFCKLWLTETASTCVLFRRTFVFL